jgi:UDP-glucose 4-epimerase
MKCLITGIAGFIGSHIAERLAQRGDDVVGVDCFLDSYPRDVKEARINWLLRDHGGIAFQEVSLLDADLEALLDGVDVVYHQAAQAGVRTSWGRTFEIYLDNNVLATQRLLEACKERPIRRFVYASSSSVYGDGVPRPTPETALTRPVSPYGVTKLAAEHLAMLYHRNFGVPSVALRYFTVYGPRPRPDMAFCIFSRAVLSGEPLHMFGDGEQSRGFTYVSDAVNANLAAAEADCVGEVINIGGPAEVSMNQVVRYLEEITGKKANVIYEEMQKGDVRHTVADTTKAKVLLGYEPRMPFRAGLEEHVRSVKEFYRL